MFGLYLFLGLPPSGCAALVPLWLEGWCEAPGCRNTTTVFIGDTSPTSWVLLWPEENFSPPVGEMGHFVARGVTKRHSRFVPQISFFPFDTPPGTMKPPDTRRLEVENNLDRNCALILYIHGPPTQKLEAFYVCFRRCLSGFSHPSVKLLPTKTLYQISKIKKSEK